MPRSAARFTVGVGPIIMLSIPRIFPILIAMALIAGCQNTILISQVATASGPYGNTHWIGLDDKRFAKLHEVISQADFEFYLDDDDKLEPVHGSHKTTISLPRPIGNTVIEQGDFPGFVVVQQHKIAQIYDVDERVRHVNQFFFAKGADRVLVTGFRGSGRQIYSDRIKKPNKASL
jgi:hypothetical protein